MANAVLYNQGSHPAGALKSGTMSLNVSPSLEVGALKWRNGFENNNTWVIYSDTYSQGQATQGNALPTIWASTDFTDSGLVNLINVLPARAGQTPFNNITSATSWLFGQGVYFLSNQNYPQIVTSGMSFMLDAGFSASFPGGTGTTWYNPSGVGDNFTLYNGPAFGSSQTKSYFNFDGTDDRARRDSETPSLEGTYDFTIETIFNAATVTGDATYGRGIVSRRALLDDTFSIKNGQMYLTRGQSSLTAALGGTINTNTWYHVVGKGNATSLSIYINGQSAATASNTSTFSGTFLNWYIGTFRDVSPITNSFFYGKINTAKLYNRELSQSEILQNYYKGPIVTSGLTLALDAGNIVSYDTSGTSWKDLTSNANHATLINGPTYSSDGGGCIVFDGSDDYANVPSPINTTTISMCCWIYLSARNAYGGFIDSYVDQWEFITDSAGEKLSFILWKNSGGYDEYKSTDNIPLNQWTFVSCSISGTSILLTLNTTSYSYTMPQSIKTGASSLKIGASISGAPQYLNGKMATAYIYNRALTYNELMQNYNAQRGRFGI